MSNSAANFRSTYDVGSVQRMANLINGNKKLPVPKHSFLQTSERTLGATHRQFPEIPMSPQQRIRLTERRVLVNKKRPGSADPRFHKHVSEKTTAGDDHRECNIASFLKSIDDQELTKRPGKHLTEPNLLVMTGDNPHKPTCDFLKPPDSAGKIVADKDSQTDYVEFLRPYMDQELLQGNHLCCHSEEVKDDPLPNGEKFEKQFNNISSLFDERIPNFDEHRDPDFLETNPLKKSYSRESGTESNISMVDDGTFTKIDLRYLPHGSREVFQQISVWLFLVTVVTAIGIAIYNYWPDIVRQAVLVMYPAPPEPEYTYMDYVTFGLVKFATMVQNFFGAVFKILGSSAKKTDVPKSV